MSALKLVSPLITRFCLFWLHDVFLAHRMAAIVNLNTLKAGQSGLLFERDALRSVEASLEGQIVAIESLLQITPDD
jgi:hypothetical protein